MSWENFDKATANGNNNKTNYTKFSEGNTLIRVLDDGPYSFWSHWLNQQRTSVTCPGKDCPICNLISQAKANKMTVPYSNSQRHALRIWNYTTNQMEVLIQGRNFMSQLSILNKDVGDLREYDIKVIRNGSDRDTTYMLMPTAPKPFEHINECVGIDMEELFKPPTHDEMLQLIEGKSWAEIRGTEEDVA